MNRKKKLFAVLAALVIFVGCGKGTGEQAAEIDKIAAAESMPSETTSGSTLYVAGDVETVINGQISAETSRGLTAMTVVGALGAGSISDPILAGEMMRLPTGFYVVPVNEKGATHGPLDEILSPFAAGVAANGPAAFTFGESFPDPVTLAAVYERIGAQAGGSFAVIGSARLTELHATFLSKSASAGQKIIDPEYAGGYFTSDTGAGWFTPGAQAFLFGIVIDKDHPVPAELGGDLVERVVYKNPFDTAPVVGGSHTHAALDKAEGLTVRHLLNQTLVTDCLLDVYPITAITEWPEETKKALE